MIMDILVSIFNVLLFGFVVWLISVIVAILCLAKKEWRSKAKWYRKSM